MDDNGFNIRKRRFNSYNRCC